MDFGEKDKTGFLINMSSQPPFPPQQPPGGSDPPPNVPPVPPAAALPPNAPRGPVPPQPPPPVRRRSVFSGLLLIVVGGLLLIATLNPGVPLGYIIGHFWPVIFILWGVAKLVDRSMLPQDGVPRPLITGGEVILIVVLLVLTLFVAAGRWIGGRFPSGDFNFGGFSQRYTQNRHVDVKDVVANSTFSVNTQNGALNIHGSDDKGLSVQGTASAPGRSQQDADNRMRDLDVVFDGQPGAYAIHPVNVRGNVSVDLDVQLPKAAAVVAKSQRGDVTVSGVQGSADTATRNGDTEIHDVSKDVTVDTQNGAVHIRSVNGAVNLTGRGGGDVELADIQGPVTINGNLFGDVEVRNAAKSFSFTSPRANVQAAALSGQLKLSNGDIELSSAAGPVSIRANNQDVRLNNIDGNIDVNTKHGDINLTFSTPPKAGVNISTDAGDITLTLPPQSTFTIAATSNSGDITDDFSSVHIDDDSHGPHQDNHTYGSGGAAIHVTTRYGDIHIGKAQ
jgi:DUF4097 and DUF4098 domain-containing protein YvlB